LLVGVFHDGTPFPMAAVIGACGLGSFVSAVVLLRE